MVVCPIPIAVNQHADQKLQKRINNTPAGDLHFHPLCGWGEKRGPLLLYNAYFTPF